MDWLAEEWSSSSKMVPGVLLVVVEFLRLVGVLEEVVALLEEVAGVAEEASCPQEAVGEADTDLRMLAWVEEAQGLQEDRGQGVGRLEQQQQQPVSAGNIYNTSEV